jgi:hypothetical protein
MTLLTVACCCGAPAYFGTPVLDQYPATPALPERVADLRLNGNDAITDSLGEWERQLGDRSLLTEKTFAGVYTDARGKRVIVVGTTGFRLDPGGDVAAEFDLLTKEYDLTQTQTVETGLRGVHQRCGVGWADGVSVVVCARADHGSLTAALFTGRSLPESGDLLARLHDAFIQRG